MMGKFMMAVGFILTGPSYFLLMPDSVWVLSLGISVLGFSTSFNIIPLFPLVMKEIKYNFRMEDNKVNDLASGLYTASFGIGAICGPLAGAYLEWLFGFRITTDVLAFVCLSLFTILIMTGEHKKLNRN